MPAHDDKSESETAPGMLGVSPSLLTSLPATDAAILAEEAKNWAQQQHFSAIGRVAAHWSYYEAVVDVCSIRLAGIDTRKGLIFTSQIAGIVRKLDVYISLARLRQLPLGTVAKLCTFADISRGLSERRNRIVHDVWYFDNPETPERFEASARRLLKIEVIPVSTTDLLQFASDIESHRQTFEQLDLIVGAAPIIAE
jgi:hypothetical protein